MSTNGNGMGPKHDWDGLRLAYVQGRDTSGGLERPTLEQLAKEHHIPAATLRSRAHRENWSGQRSDFHTSLIHKTREMTLEQLAEKASQLDVQAFSVARAAIALLGKEFIEGMQAGSLSLADRERLLRMCDTAHRMARRALWLGDTSE
jgi:hypothetical protein